LKFHEAVVVVELLHYLRILPQAEVKAYVGEDGVEALKEVSPNLSYGHKIH
jgi:hypothetical protein